MTVGGDPVAIFCTEARELLERVEGGLLDLSVRPGERAIIDDVFRSLHTLKGSGSMFGFDALAAFTHHCESAFDRVRKGEVEATNNLLSVVLEAKDHMRALIEGSADEAHGLQLIARLEREVESAAGRGAATAPADARTAPAQGWRSPPRRPGPAWTSSRCRPRHPFHETR